MDLVKAKRFVSFVYWIPAIIVIIGGVVLPHYVFLALPIPYYVVAFYLIKQTPKDERTQIDYARIVLISISHLVLYYLMYWG
ncbi:hypothetical protein JKA74_09795 [Marivirga sp. S37H4]|uniref:Uncharacterized protein n=1 Tax=Marivirga aurantiaca TaxID=2802615 RepID=A0A935C928_9BACT|nr:hypothetical protein [Marivirga aurantiaca]MBK6265332.1 hypothetical protein [Marivirga aurantiaca]